MEGYNLGRGRSENEGKGTGNKKHKWQVQNRQVEVKYSMENGEAKQLICMTHGLDLRWRNYGGMRGTGQRGIKGRQLWDNYNSITNKLY